MIQPGSMRTTCCPVFGYKEICIDTNTNNIQFQPNCSNCLVSNTDILTTCLYNVQLTMICVSIKCISV